MSTIQDIEIREPAAAADELRDVAGEKMVLNMGPSHPATHGVLRLVLYLDGETIIDIETVMGYLHRGTEKLEAPSLAKATRYYNHRFWRHSTGST